MGHSSNKKTNEMKQVFLTSAISDMATWIQVTDTKVSIIMGALVALIAGGLSCAQYISDIFSDIKPCSWIGVMLIITIVLLFISIIGVFVFGTLTIRGHKSLINYESKWFLSKHLKEYSFEIYIKELKEMTDNDVIENMGAELYKLNDINRQKTKTMKWTIYLFASTLGIVAIIGILLLINTL